MRVLQISHNHHVVGGSDRVFFETSALLQNSGHQVIPFCLKSPRNIPSDWSEYFPRGAKTGNPTLADMPRYFWNRDAKDRLNRLLDAVGPVDVAHLHIYHGKMTPAILPVLKSRGIPVVHSLHEYKLACPVYTLQRHGRNCELCVTGSKLNGVRYRCKDGSVLKSAVMVAEMVTSRLLGDVRLIDRFICVSEFQRQVMIRAGLPESKLVTLHNFVDPLPNVLSGHTGQLLYVGRIEALKGLPTLLDAVQRTGSPLLIAGAGSWVPELQARIRDVPNIRFLGFLNGPDLQAVMKTAKAVVVPSEWYENCPMSVLEAKAAGRPVIAARIGGIPELVRDRVDGFLHASGDAADLACAIREMQDFDFQTLSANACQDVADRFSGARHLTRLTEVYQEADQAARDRRKSKRRPIALRPEPKPAANSG